MNTFVLIRGGSAWDWHLVAPALRERGQDAVAIDLPCEDESADWPAYVETIDRAVGDRATSSSSGTRSAASRRPS